MFYATNVVWQEHGVGGIKPEEGVTRGEREGLGGVRGGGEIKEE